MAADEDLATPSLSGSGAPLQKFVRPSHMGGCQNYGPFLGTLHIRGRTIIGTQKGTIILTTTHIFEAELSEVDQSNPNAKDMPKTWP